MLSLFFKKGAKRSIRSFKKSERAICSFLSNNEWFSRKTKSEFTTLFLCLSHYWVCRFLCLCCLMGFVAYCVCVTLWGLSVVTYWVCRITVFIIRVVAYWVCHIMGLVVLWGLLHYGVCRLLGGPVAYGICRSIEKSFFNVFLTLQYSKYSEIWLCGVNNTVELDNAELDSAIPKTPWSLKLPSLTPRCQ